MTFRGLSLSLALVVTASLASAQGPTAADRAAAEGRHEDAARALGASMTNGWSTPLLVDLGNAQYRQGRIGEAILAWERARILSPQDDAVLTNLERARLEHALAPPLESLAERASRALSVRQWLTFGAASLAVFALATIALSLARRLRAWLTLASVLSTVGIAVTTMALWMGTLAVDRGVIVEGGGVVARLSPFEDADPIGTFPEGEVVVLAGIHDRWARLEMQGGASAWVPLGAVEPIVENASAL